MGDLFNQAARERLKIGRMVRVMVDGEKWIDHSWQHMVDTMPGYGVIPMRRSNYGKSTHGGIDSSIAVIPDSKRDFGTEKYNFVTPERKRAFDTYETRIDPMNYRSPHFGFHEHLPLNFN